MYQARGKPRQSPQALDGIEIAQQRRHTLGAQFSHPFGLRGESQQPDPAPHLLCDAQADITATDNQQPLTAKSRRQCA